MNNHPQHTLPTNQRRLIWTLETHDNINNNDNNKNKNIDSINDNNNMYQILMSCVLGMLLCQTPYMQWFFIPSYKKYKNIMRILWGIFKII